MTLLCCGDLTFLNALHQPKLKGIPHAWQQPTLDKLRNLYEKICTFENLLQAYRNAAKNKRYRDEVLIFSQNLETNLFELLEELKNRTYRVGKYREFYVNYPKRRLVMALAFPDRIVQWAIYQQINPFIDKRFIEHSYGCRNGKGTLAAVEQLFCWIQLISRKPDAADWRVVKLDVSKFFYRIDHVTALDVYGEYIDDEWFDWLIGTIICDENVPFGLPPGRRADDCPRSERLFDVGLPIGNLTSQETANVYLDRLDKFCKHTLRIKHYIRYMDDTILIVKAGDVQRVRDAIEAYLATTLKLTLNGKTGVYRVDQPLEFVGSIITPHGVRLRKQTIRHAKRAMKHIEEMYAVGAVDLDSALETIRSYIGLTQHKSGCNLRRWIEENIVLRRGNAGRERAHEQRAE